MAPAKRLKSNTIEPACILRGIIFHCDGCCAPQWLDLDVQLVVELRMESLTVGVMVRECMKTEASKTGHNVLGQRIRNHIRVNNVTLRSKSEVFEPTQDSIKGRHRHTQPRAHPLLGHDLFALHEVLDLISGHEPVRTCGAPLNLPLPDVEVVP